MSEENNKEKKTKRRILGIILAILIIIILLLLHRCQNIVTSENSLVGIQNSTLSEDELVSQLTDTTNASRIWVSVASDIVVDNGYQCAAYDANSQQMTILDNLSNNQKDIIYTITLEDEVIYTSPIIPPDKGIATFDLDRILEKGVYSCKVTAQPVSEDGTPEGGTISVFSTLHVL